MKIPSSNGAPRPNKQSAKKSGDLGFKEKVPDYTGPADGLSRPSTGWIQPLNRAFSALAYRVEVDNPEDLSQEGARIYAPNHPRWFDPLLVATMFDRDVRTVANFEFMTGIKGRLMARGGAIPVDLERGSMTTVRHSLEILGDEIGLTVYGEAKNSENPKQPDPMKTGIGMFAVRGGAEAVVPIAINYKENDQPRWGERLAGLGLATAVGATCALAGSPLAQAATMIGAGALTGMYVGGSVGRAFTANPNYKDTFPKFFSGLKWGAAGAVAGGLAGYVLKSVPGASLAMGVVGGLATFGLANAWTDREVCQIRIGDELKVDDFVKKYGKRDAQQRIVEDLHTSIGHMMEDMSGVPYDDSAPKTK